MLVSRGTSWLMQLQDVRPVHPALVAFPYRHGTSAPRSKRSWNPSGRRSGKLNRASSGISSLSSNLGGSSSRRNRQEEVMLCRLRIGHTYATHGHILRGEENPVCSRCRVPLTVAHVLLSCPHVRRSRACHLGHIASNATLRDILGDESDWISTGRVFSFFRAIQFPLIYRP